jgi:hypothetical protein
MTAPKTNNSLQSGLFDTVASMITSTPVMLDEPLIMSTFRMLHYACTLISLLEHNGQNDEFLSLARTDFERERTLVMSDPEQFITWMNGLSDRFVHEVKRRNCTSPSSSTT